MQRAMRSLRQAGVLISVAAITGSLALLASPGPAANAATTHDVAIVDFAFNPAAITVAVGDTVRWTNAGAMDHTVTSTSGPATFDSGVLGPGQTFAFIFTSAGEYGYHCQLHNTMTGTITVLSPAAPTPVPTVAGIASAAVTASPATAASSLPNSSLPHPAGPIAGFIAWVVLVAGGVALVAIGAAGRRRAAP
jgi:plastocyanin